MTYAGAASRLTAAAAAALDSRRWGYQPKVDGAYALVLTDGRGFLRRLLSRNGLPFAPADFGDLIGIQTGHPDAALIGELECHTPAGVAARTERGFAQVHLYDALRLSGRDCAGLPYAERLAQLHRERSVAECEARDPWEPVAGKRGHRLAATGRFDAKVPRDHRRLPIVPTSRDFRSAWWEHVDRVGGEGLVAVRMDAKLGARNSKRKIKPTDTFTGRLVSRDSTAASIDYKGIRFVVSAQSAWSKLIEVGALVDFACDGWTPRSEPRNPRLVRPRPDLVV